MSSIPLIAVIVITNGNSNNYRLISNSWTTEGFIAGETFFYCGPRLRLLANGIAEKSIIEYEDLPYYGSYFHINHKKLGACEAVKATYIYLVHDRFIPKTGFLNTLSNVLSGERYDFGAVDVLNPDGTVALSELRLKESVLSLDLDKALELLGRLTCSKEDSRASKQVAVNGGQFFLRKTYSKYLKRPMRWIEMEDDILSHDLQFAKGVWVSRCKLITLAPRNAPIYQDSLSLKLKYYLYKCMCNLIARMTGSVSVGENIDQDKLIKLVTTGVLLIDPLHKVTSSDFLPSTLEKLMARARILCSGTHWSNIVKHPLGWKLVGSETVDLT